ncbi:MAG TPA: methionyl-tRNA formyltransferase [Thermoanaerobaculia bacterium]|nr:methionyl-tRNA formyltransferase [Thermoanaerobaculia bacterium]
MNPADPSRRAESSGPSASTRRLRIVFFGTPEFAVPSLARLAAEPGFRITLAVTQPDRPAGRHADPIAPPVARVARDRGIPLLQPERLRGSPDVLERLRAERPEAIVVVAYGKILPPEILAIPRLGCVNVHGSLLPRHRGASPVQAAILAGDRTTGVSTMRMTEGLDEGPVYLVREIPVLPEDTAATLAPRLSAAGADLLVETILGIASGKLVARPQEGEPTYCRAIRRTDGEIDWTLPAAEIARRLRAFTPWPGVFTSLEGERVKILEAREGAAGRPGAPGTIEAAERGVTVVCGSGTSLVVDRVQREGRKPVPAAEFLRGARHPEGARFGNP